MELEAQADLDADAGVDIHMEVDRDTGTDVGVGTRVACSSHARPSLGLGISKQQDFHASYLTLCPQLCPHFPALLRCVLPFTLS